MTTEFENVPAEALRRLAERVPVAPGGAAVAVCQDRALEKATFARCGVPCAPHAVIDNEAAIRSLSEDLLPGILKTAQLGYDGKGQRRVDAATSSRRRGASWAACAACWSAASSWRARSAWCWPAVSMAA